jgi:hypothetical protein
MADAAPETAAATVDPGAKQAWAQHTPSSHPPFSMHPLAVLRCAVTWEWLKTGDVVKGENNRHTGL